MNGNGVWKWVAALLATILLAGLPGYVRLYVTSPTKGEVSLIRDRQDSVLQRLAAIEQRLNNGDTENMRLREEIKELARLLSQR